MISAVPSLVYIIAIGLIMCLAMLKGYSHTKFEDVAIAFFGSICVPFAFSVFVRLRDMFINEQFGIYLIFFALSVLSARMSELSWAAWPSANIRCARTLAPKNY